MEIVRLQVVIGQSLCRGQVNYAGNGREHVAEPSVRFPRLLLWTFIFHRVVFPGSYSNELE
jgi:hypothetical protein